MKLSEEQKRYIKENVNYRPRKELARKVGISYNSLLRWVHIYGGEIDKDSFETRVELRGKIRELYKTNSASEIASILGLSRASVNGYVNRMHLHREEGETKERLRKKSERNHMYLHTDDAKKKKAIALKNQIRRDFRNIISGKKPITKRYYCPYPHRTSLALNHLCYKYGYFLPPKEGRTANPIAYYDKDTKRLSRKREEYYENKYHIEFVCAD